MIIYLLKTIICTAIFLGVYLLLLEKEKMHRFNRFYLLFSIVISFFIPVINIEIKATINPIEVVNNVITPENTTVFLHQTIAPVKENISLTAILVGFYICIALFFLCRFIRSLVIIHKKVKRNKSVSYLNTRLILMQEYLVPHSFLGNIFLNKIAFEKGDIEKEILQHELTHVKQKHSFDILFIELILVFVWFNPIFYFYRKAIKLNHEFLADDAVVRAFNNIPAYQYLLLAVASQPNNYLPTSQFNFLVTKKRLIMMTKQTSNKIAFVKQIALLPFIAILVFLFSTTTIAQVSEKVQADTAKQTAVVFGSGATQQELDEYDATLKSISSPRKLKSGREVMSIDMKKCNRDRMAYIYKQMSDEQSKPRKWSGVLFVGVTPPTKKTPTNNQMEVWQDAKKYGIWIDDKRVANNALTNYKANNFVLYYESKLAKNAINYGKHYFQVDLYTPAHYDETFLKKHN